MKILTRGISILLVVTIIGCSEKQLTQTPYPLGNDSGGPSTLMAPSPLAAPTKEESGSDAPANDANAPNSELRSYTGPNSYGSGYPDFTIEYDPAVWAFALDPVNGNNEIESTQVISCALQLHMGPIGAPEVARKQIGGYQWIIWGTNSPRVFLYGTQVTESLYLFFATRLPDAEPTERNQQCTKLAETVMSTARFVDR